MILISPFSRKLRWGDGENPKNPPDGWWEEVQLRLISHHTVQIGVSGERKIAGMKDYLFDRPLDKLSELIKKFDCWISVDNFFPHLANLQKKRGVVVFSQSNPKIFGYDYNINLYKPEFLRENQFWLWEQAEYKAEAFVEPQVVVDAVNQILKEKTDEN